MAKINSPLMSESASGTINKNITFSIRKSGQQVRFQKKQKDRKSNPQIIQRAKYKFATTEWNQLNNLEKKAWQFQAMAYSMSGYNLFVRYILTIDEEASLYGQSIFGLSEY